MLSDSGGELLTKPLRFDGKALDINFVTSGRGSVQVEIQTELGKPIKGFRLQDCPPVRGDSIDQTVAWNAGSDVRSLIGKPVRLRFQLQDADLYAFRFRP